MQMKCAQWNAIDYCLIDKLGLHLFLILAFLIVHMVYDSLNSPLSQLYHLTGSLIKEFFKIFDTCSFYICMS